MNLKNNELGYNKPNNNNGSYDDSVIKAQLEHIEREKITNAVSIRKFGAKFDGSDETKVLQDALNYSNEHKVAILLDGKLNIRNTITLPEYSCIISSAKSTTYSNKQADSLIYCEGFEDDYVFTSNGESVSLYLKDVIILNNQDYFKFSRKINLFHNVGLKQAPIINGCIFTGFKNIFYNCDFFAIAKITNTTVYCCYESIFNKCQIGDMYITNNYFSGAGIKDENNKVFYPHLFKDNKLCSLVDFSNNWCEFFKSPVPEKANINSIINRNIFDYCYEFYLIQNNSIFTNNIINRYDKGSILNNMSGFGDVHPDVLENKISTLIFGSGPVVCTNNSFYSGKDAKDNIEIDIRGCLRDSSNSDYDIGRLTIKDNVFNTNVKIKMPDNFKVQKMNSIDIDFKDYFKSESMININTLPPGFKYRLPYVEEGKCEEVKIKFLHGNFINTINGVPVGFGYNLFKPIKKLNITNGSFWDNILFIDNHTMSINYKLSQWYQFYTEEVPVEKDCWYYYVNHSIANETELDSNIELQGFDSAGKQLYTISYNSNNCIFKVTDNNVSCVKIAFKMRTPGEYIFRDYGLYKYDSKTLITNTIKSKNNLTYRTYLDTETMSIIAEPWE